MVIHPVTHVTNETFMTLYTIVYGPCTLPESFTINERQNVLEH